MKREDPLAVCCKVMLSMVKRDEGRMVNGGERIVRCSSEEEEEK